MPQSKGALRGIWLLRHVLDGKCGGGYYASIRVAPERKGAPIVAHDMLIAAHARAIDAVCVTDNVAEFRRVPALKIENWLK